MAGEWRARKEGERRVGMNLTVERPRGPQTRVMGRGSELVGR